MEYIGDEMPKWVREGAKVKVKTTLHTRQYGLMKSYGNDRAWPGEVGVIRKTLGNGWWCWAVDFPRGLTYSLSLQLLEDLVRVREKPSANS